MVRERGDLPVAELLELANRVITNLPSAVIYFKFTCEKCGSRQAFDKPYLLYSHGRCEECNHITNIKTGGFILAATYRGMDWRGEKRIGQERN